MARIFLLFALLASGCSVAGPSDADIEAARSPDADGVIVNLTSADFVPVAVDTAISMEYEPEFEIRDRSTIVASGDARALRIGGYERGENFVVLVYRVRGTTATYASTLLADADDFERDAAVLTVRRF